MSSLRASTHRNPAYGRQPLASQPPFVVTDQAGLLALLEVARRSPAVAVDTESNSLFAYYHRICLIQVSLPGVDYVVDPLACDVSPLQSLFADAACQKVFHAAENDILGFKRDYGFAFANVFDTMLAARILGWPQFGLAAILAERFGVTLDKRMQRTNWGQRPLHPDQVSYAQLDTHYLLPLRDQQVQALQQAGRWEEAQERFQSMTTLEWVEKPFDSDGFWRIDGARSLSPRELSVLRELYLLRERLARQLDSPPFKVFDQRLLLTLSRQQPQTLGELRRTPALNANSARRFGQAILEAIASGLSAPAPLPPRRVVDQNNNGRPDAHTLARYNALRNWRTARARQRGVEPDVVLTNDALMAIARQAPSSLEALAASDVVGPWKLQEYGPDILRVLLDAAG